MSDEREPLEPPPTDRSWIEMERISDGLPMLLPVAVAAVLIAAFGIWMVLS